MSQNEKSGAPVVDSAAHTFARELVDKYHKQRVGTPHLSTICIDFTGNYPEDELLEKAGEILAWRWNLEPRQFEAAGCRAGCIWMTPKFRNK